MLDGTENTFVVCADAVKAEIRGRVILALRWVDQAQEPACLRIARAGTGGSVCSRRDSKCTAGSGAGPCAGNVDRRIDFVADHQMRSFIAEVGDGCDPVLRELVLNAEVPCLERWRQSLGLEKGIG